MHPAVYNALRALERARVTLDAAKKNYDERVRTLGLAFQLEAAEKLKEQK